MDQRHATFLKGASMRRIIVVILAVLLVHTVAAADSADHPLVGRYPDSSIQTQEVSNFGRYTILVGEEETEAVEGEVWMTLYQAPDDSSTFSVYSTYLAFLEAEGFTILTSYEPGTGGTIVQEAYHRAPFADDGNMNYSAPITNGTWGEGCYISAKRERGGATIYVSIAIAAGWYAFPQYKLDVVEIAANTASIVSVGTREEEEPAPDATAAGSPAEPLGTAGATPPTTDAEPGGLFSGTGSVRAMAGAGVFSFADPDFAGGLVEQEYLGVSTGTPGGFRNLSGPFAEVCWFLNRNLGILANVAYFTVENEDTIDDTTFSSDADLIFIQAGAMARVVGDAFPVTLGCGFSVGIVLIEFYQNWQTDTDGQWFTAQDFFPALTYSAELTIPIVSVGRLSSGFQYTFVPVSDLTFEQDGGSDYSINYYEPNLGGFTLRVGLVVEL
jgi:hypothetical protein